MRSSASEQRCRSDASPLASGCASRSTRMAHLRRRPRLPRHWRLARRARSIFAPSSPAQALKWIFAPSSPKRQSHRLRHRSRLLRRRRRRRRRQRVRPRPLPPWRPPRQLQPPKRPLGNGRPARAERQTGYSAPLWGVRASRPSPRPPPRREQLRRWAICEQSCPPPGRAVLVRLLQRWLQSRRRRASGRGARPKACNPTARGARVVRTARRESDRRRNETPVARFCAMFFCRACLRALFAIWRGESCILAQWGV